MGIRDRRRNRQQRRHDRGGGLGQRGILPRVFPGQDHSQEQPAMPAPILPPAQPAAPPEAPSPAVESAPPGLKDNLKSLLKQIYGTTENPELQALVGKYDKKPMKPPPYVCNALAHCSARGEGAQGSYLPG